MTDDSLEPVLTLDQRLREHVGTLDVSLFTLIHLKGLEAISGEVKNVNFRLAAENFRKLWLVHKASRSQSLLLTNILDDWFIQHQAKIDDIVREVIKVPIILIPGRDFQ